MTVPQKDKLNAAHMSSLGNLVPQGPSSVFYATKCHLLRSNTWHVFY